MEREDYSQKLNDLLVDEDFEQFKIVQKHCVDNKISFVVTYRKHFERYVQNNNMKSATVIYELSLSKNILKYDDFLRICEKDNAEFAKWFYNNSFTPLDIFSELGNSCSLNRINIVMWLDEFIERKNISDNFNRSVKNNCLIVAKYLYGKYRNQVVVNHVKLLQDAISTKNIDMIDFVVNIIDKNIIDIKFIKNICIKNELIIAKYFIDNFAIDVLNILIDETKYETTKGRKMIMFEVLCNKNIDTASYLFNRLDCKTKEMLMSKCSVPILKNFFLEDYAKINVLEFIYENNKKSSNTDRIRNKILSETFCNGVKYLPCGLKKYVSIIKFCVRECITVDCTRLHNDLMINEKKKGLNDDEHELKKVIENNKLVSDRRCIIL